MAKRRRGSGLPRLARPQTLLSRTEQVLRAAIARGEFGDRLPPATELAEQLGVSRETVRLAPLRGDDPEPPQSHPA